MPQPVILSACRTPIGKFGKSLLSLTAPDLGAVAIREALVRAKAPVTEVDEVIMGNVISAGLGQNPARRAAIDAKIPYSVGSITVNKVCGSGLKAVMLAAQAIKAGDAEVVVAGGMESMSNAPYLAMNLRWGLRHGNGSLVDAMINDGLWDHYHGFHMGMTGELIAKRFRITRREADEFAFQSQQKAARAAKSGIFDDEKVAVRTGGEKGEAEFFEDECIRPDTTIEKLATLKPAFKSGGILTAGNSSQLSDGAAAVVVASEEAAEKLGAKPMARVVAYGTGGLEPGRVMEAPIPTTREVLKKAKLGVDDIDLFEHNEAYAAASIAVRRALNVDEKRFNVNGGAVALGHPIGCSGARVLATLLYQMKRSGGRLGLATLCLGGGNAVTMIVERPSP